MADGRVYYTNHCKQRLALYGSRGRVGVGGGVERGWD